MKNIIKSKKFRIFAIVVAVIMIISSITIFVVNYYALARSRVTARFSVLEEGDTFYLSLPWITDEFHFIPDPDIQNRMFSMLSEVVWYSPPYSRYSPYGSPYSLYHPYTQYIIHITEDTRISFEGSLITLSARYITLGDGQTLADVLDGRKIVVIYGDLLLIRGIISGVLPITEIVTARRIIVLDE